MSRYFININLVLVLLLGLSCSSGVSVPSEEQIKEAIKKQVQSEIKGNQKVTQISIIKKDDKPSHADLEKAGSHNPFWTVISHVKTSTTVAKKKFPLFKRKYKTHVTTKERQFRVWLDSNKKWIASPLVI